MKSLAVILVVCAVYLSPAFATADLKARCQGPQDHLMIWNSEKHGIVITTFYSEDTEAFEGVFKCEAAGTKGLDCTGRLASIWGPEWHNAKAQIDDSVLTSGNGTMELSFYRSAFRYSCNAVLPAE